jgi:hypothetical protein
VAAAAAGMDLLLFSETDAPGVTGALARALERGRLDLESLRASCARTVSLKDELGGTAAG